MAPPHPYIDEVRKGAFINDLKHGYTLSAAARDTGINVKTARGIKRRANEIIIFNDNHDLPPPTLSEQVAKRAKTGRPHVLSEIEINTLNDAISADKHHRELPFFEVAQELDLHVSKSIIRQTTRALHFHRVKPTKKLALTDIQEALRYEITLSRKDWTLDD